MAAETLADAERCYCSATCYAARLNPEDCPCAERQIKLLRIAINDLTTTKCFDSRRVFTADSALFCTSLDRDVLSRALPENCLVSFGTIYSIIVCRRIHVPVQQTLLSKYLPTAIAFAWLDTGGSRGYDVHPNGCCDWRHFCGH